MTTLERWDYGVYMARLHLDHVIGEGQSPLQFAYVGRYPLLDPKRLGETVAINRGLTVKVTEDFHEAMSWLGVSADDTTAAAQGE